MSRGPIRILTLNGSHFDMGVAHGEAYKDQIRSFASERIDLVCSGLWSHAELTRPAVLEVAERCVSHHYDYSPGLTSEMEGLASATGLSMAELVVANGFTDFIDTIHALYKDANGPVELSEDDCTATLIPDRLADGAGFYAQTWDMHDTATDFVVLLDINPDDAPRSFVFTTTGCLGQMGMNEAGICVGINNVAGEDGRVGVNWTMVVRKALEQTNLDDALACITDAHLAGSHNYLLRDAEGNGYNVEAYPTVTEITPMGDSVLAHTNHAIAESTKAVSQPRLTELQISSEARLATAITSLDKDQIGIDDVIEMTRNPTICYRGKEPFHVETCGAAIMRPATGDFWACWGLPSENEYQHMRFSEG